MTYQTLPNTETKRDLQIFSVEKLRRVWRFDETLSRGLDHRDPEHFISKKNVLLFTFVRVCFESFRRDLNEAKAVYIAVIKINVLLFTFVRVSF